MEQQKVSVTVDSVVFANFNDEFQVLLIKRKKTLMENNGRCREALLTRKKTWKLQRNEN